MSKDRAGSRVNQASGEQHVSQGGTPFAEWLTTREAATRVKRSMSTLKLWRILGKGPAYRRFYGRIYYNPIELDRWIREAIGLGEDEL